MTLLQFYAFAVIFAKNRKCKRPFADVGIGMMLLGGVPDSGRSL